MSRGGGRLAFACAVASVLLACSREDDQPKQFDLVPGFARVPNGAGEGGASTGRAARRDEPWPSDADASARTSFQMTVMHTVNVVREAGAPPVVNPDDAILERARVAAGGCFASLPAGAGYAPERSAHIVFTVIPTGTVSNADVSSRDTTDERVLGCLRQQAMSTPFSDNAGGPLRTYAIDVRVIAKGNERNGGGR